MGKYDVNSINLKVDKVVHTLFGILIRWSSDIGFGEYTISESDQKSEAGEVKWVARSECMDKDDDKEFGKKLLELWMEQI